MIKGHCKQEYVLYRYLMTCMCALLCAGVGRKPTGVSGWMYELHMEKWPHAQRLIEPRTFLLCEPGNRAACHTVPMRHAIFIPRCRLGINPIWKFHFTVINIAEAAIQCLHDLPFFCDISFMLWCSECTFRWFAVLCRRPSAIPTVRISAIIK